MDARRMEPMLARFDKGHGVRRFVVATDDTFEPWSSKRGEPLQDGPRLLQRTGQENVDKFVCAPGGPVLVLSRAFVKYVHGNADGFVA